VRVSASTYQGAASASSSTPFRIHGTACHTLRACRVHKDQAPAGNRISAHPTGPFARRAIQSPAMNSHASRSRCSAGPCSANQKLRIDSTVPRHSAMSVVTAPETVQNRTVVASKGST
jgi:hypothetical protein